MLVPTLWLRFPFVGVHSSPLSMVLLSSVSVTRGQSQFKNTKWKIPEINNW